jgi:hypothetical protein
MIVQKHDFGQSKSVVDGIAALPPQPIPMFLPEWMVHSAVMAVTLPRDRGYSGSFPLSAYCEVHGRCKMQKDERDLLEVLKCELQFLERGGYGCSPRTPWRPQYIFEDSVTCVNYDSKENPDPCGVPCRHIPFNVSGETLDSLYRYSDQNEIEETVEGWLRVAIQCLQEEWMAARQAHCKQPTPRRGTSNGTPRYQKQHPKCVNPASPTAEDYRDVLEVVKFDLIEETVGSRLRAIIRRLEEEQTAIRRD